MRAWAFASFLAAACAQPAEPPIEMRVVWGVGDAAALPDDVVDIEIVTCINAGQDDEECDNFTCSLNALTGMTPNEVPGCRPRAGTEMYGTEPVLIRTDLPTDSPIEFRLHGRDSSGNVAHVGQTGPIILGDGERRFITLQMFAMNASTQAIGASVSRILHTSTLLPDGRILIAGGFSTLTPVACPASLMLAADAVCFDLIATDEALAYDISSGSVTSIRAPMLAARGGHTATALPDGRVLIAGGAARAVLAMVPQGAAGAGGYALRLVPYLADGVSEGAEASLELFDAYLNAEPVDGERDGDPGRGQFIGTAGQSSAPVPMNQPRFMHAAAQVAMSPSRVVLVGGMGSADSASTWEVFDNDRVGGYGVYTADDNRLNTPRAMPAAIGIGSRVWIFGGSIARENAHLAEIWTSDAVDPNGAVMVAAGNTQFPNAVPDNGESHPEYALIRPQVASIESSRALVVGWYGAQCEPGTSNTIFPSIGMSSELCNAPAMPMTRSFTVTDASGLTAPTQARFHAFGDAAILTCFKPTLTTRYVAITGGAANTSWNGQPTIDIFAGTVDAAGAADRLMGSAPTIGSTRLFHTSTGIPGLGVVTIGGASFGVSVSQLFMVDAVEVLFLPSPAPDDC